MSKIEAGAAVTLVIAIVGAALWLGKIQTKLNSIDVKNIRNERDTAVGEVERAKNSAMTNLEQLGTQVPVGSIFAWFGLAQDVPDGYMICNGEILQSDEYPKLHSLLVASNAQQQVGEDRFRLPDLRGYFIRGLDDPDGEGTLGSAGRDPYTNENGEISYRAIGTTQDYSTASPREGLRISGGSHEHTEKIRDNDNAAVGAGTSNGSRGAGTSSSKISGGAHSHAVSGWDSESRPVNVALNYIIKVK